jgi:DNA-directed RNA polymerase II subunit RPB1
MTFQTFLKSVMVFHEEFGKPVHPDYTAEVGLIRQIEQYNAGRPRPGDLVKWCVRFVLDREQLSLKSMKLETILLAIKQEFPDIYLVNTPETAKEIFIRCYFRATIFKKKKKAPKTFFQELLMPVVEQLRAVIVRGVSGIVNTTVVKVIKNKAQADGSLARSTIFGIQTDGTNLSEILENPYIDPYRTQSDSVEEMEEIYGITAARNKIMTELTTAMPGLNEAHCSLFADEMTFSGETTSIQRTGLQKRENANVLLRTSFQTPIQVLTDAAVNGLVDRVGGISAPLMLGSTVLSGSTYNKTIVNRAFLKANAKQIDDVLDDL